MKKYDDEVDAALRDIAKIILKDVFTRAEQDYTAILNATQTTQKQGIDTPESLSTVLKALKITKDLSQNMLSGSSPITIGSIGALNAANIIAQSCTKAAEQDLKDILAL